ncbi:unnamed protein product [Caenorhabditis nigoni]
MSAIEKNHRTPVQSTKPEVRKCGIGMIKKTKERNSSQQSQMWRSRRPEEKAKDYTPQNSVKLDLLQFFSQPITLMFWTLEITFFVFF